MIRGSWLEACLCLFLPVTSGDPLASLSALVSTPANFSQWIITEAVSRSDLVLRFVFFFFFPAHILRIELCFPPHSSVAVLTLNISEYDLRWRSLQKEPSQNQIVRVSSNQIWLVSTYRKNAMWTWRLLSTNQGERLGADSSLTALISHQHLGNKFV